MPQRRLPDDDDDRQFTASGVTTGRFPMNNRLLREMFETGPDKWISALLGMNVYLIRKQRALLRIPIPQVCRGVTKAEVRVAHDRWITEWRQKLADAAIQPADAASEGDDLDTLADTVEAAAEREHSVRQVIASVDRRREAQGQVRLDDKSLAILIAMSSLPNSPSLHQIGAAAARIIDRRDMTPLLKIGLVEEVHRTIAPPLGFNLTYKGQHAASAIHDHHQVRSKEG